MYISIKNNKGFDNDDFRRISDYLLSARFKRQMEIDHASKHDDQTRTICEIDKQHYIVRHSEFAVQNIDETMQDMHLSSMDRYGLIDVFQLGTDANKSSTLYWIVATKAKIVQHTGLGLVCKNSHTNKGDPKQLARFDKLWIAGSQNSTVFVIDQGSSHMVT